LKVKGITLHCQMADTITIILCNILDEIDIKNPWKWAKGQKVTITAFAAGILKRSVSLASLSQSLSLLWLTLCDGFTLNFSKNKIVGHSTTY